MQCQMTRILQILTAIVSRSPTYLFNIVSEYENVLVERVKAASLVAVPGR